MLWTPLPRLDETQIGLGTGQKSFGFGAGFRRGGRGLGQCVVSLLEGLLGILQADFHGLFPLLEGLQILLAVARHAGTLRGDHDVFAFGFVPFVVTPVAVGPGAEHHVRVALGDGITAASEQQLEHVLMLVRVAVRAVGHGGRKEAGSRRV